MFRSTVLPKVQNAVNHAPEYADLRRIYLSRVAAEWYRKRDAARDTMFASLINTGDVSYWPARTPWKPKDVFDAYVKSYTKGEFNVKHTTRQGNEIITRTYVYGGVDFSRVPYTKIDASKFAAKHSGLPGVVQQSLQRPSVDQKGAVWYGAQADPVPANPADQPVAGRLGTSTTALIFRLLLCLLLVVAVVALAIFLVRWRRRHGTPPPGYPPRPRA